MEELDRWALHQLQDLNGRILRAYQDFDFHIVFHRLHNFCALDLSSFYLDIIKDRLYVSPPKSRARRSAQSALHEILQVLIRLMAPVLSFTADEIWQYMNGDRTYESVHMDQFVSVKENYKDPELASRWDLIVRARRTVTKAIELARNEKRVGHSLDASVEVGVSKDLAEKLRPYEDQLRSIFIVSSVRLIPENELPGGFESEELPGIRVAVKPSKDPKCDRCWVRDSTVGENNDHPTLCRRCTGALTEMEFSRA
jgi:isoleucyl-tRNA synthetase